jgi:MFS family permease
MAAQIAAPRGRAIRLVSTMVAVAFTLLAIAWSLQFSNLGGIVIAAVYAVPGLFLALRRPGQPLAWLLLLIGLGLALGTTVPTASPTALQASEADGVGQLTAWAQSAGWVLFFSGFLGILLTFPSGTLPRGRWRAVSLVLIATIAFCGGLIVVGPTLDVDVPGQPVGVTVPNPFGLPLLAQLDEDTPGVALLFPMLLVCQVVAFMGMVARSRRSTGLERLQYRWLGSAVAVVVLGIVVWMFVALVVQTDLVLLPALILGMTFPAIPIAVVIAVLRYRLYEIDRLVSRSVGWALATAAVVGVFAAGVLAFGALLSGLAQGQAVATAAATLLAFALFQPVRTRLQRIVDRRFDRPRIEAERTLRRHGERLAHVVELDVIERAVLETVAETVRPVAASLWIRP